MKLDLGGGWGSHALRDFIEVDLVIAMPGGVLWDLSQFPYPWADNTVELIHCSHTLEHLCKQDAINLLRECYRILVPGGILTLAVPDMDILIEGHLTGDWSGHPQALLDLIDLNYCGGDKHPVNEAWRHRYMWCWESLAYVLEKIGYVEVERHGHEDGKYVDLFAGGYNQDFSTITLYVDAVKPGK